MGRFKVRTSKRIELSPTFDTRADAEKWVDTVEWLDWSLALRTRQERGSYFGGLEVYDTKRDGDMTPEQAEIAVLREWLEAMTAERDQVIRDREQAKAELEAMTAACDCYREAMNRARADLAAMTDERVQAEIAELRERLEAMTTERDNARAELAMLRDGDRVEIHAQSNEDAEVIREICSAARLGFFLSPQGIAALSRAVVVGPVEQVVHGVAGVKGATGPHRVVHKAYLDQMQERIDKITRERDEAIARLTDLVEGRIQDFVQRLLDTSGDDARSSIYCDHANENPHNCPCPDTCWCRQPGRVCADASGATDSARGDEG